MTSPTDAVEALVRHPLAMRRLEVRAVTRPTPRLARVELGGAALEGFVSLAPDDHVKVFFPAAGAREPRLPEIGAQGVVWPSDGPRPIARDYTPARVDVAAGVLELDIVLHPGGHGAEWARRAAPGAVLGIAGPRGSHVLRRPFDGYVFAADETGLPAVRRWARELPSGVDALAVVEVLDAGDEEPCPSAATVDVVWVHRARGERLADALAAAAFPSGEVFAWAGAEAGAVQRIRRHLAEARGLPAERCRLRGYWKAGVEDHQEPHDD